MRRSEQAREIRSGRRRCRRQHRLRLRQERVSRHHRRRDVPDNQRPRQRRGGHHGRVNAPRPCHTSTVSRTFSSKGPTGDGRLKPDLVAPGEKIISCATGKMKSDAEAQAQIPDCDYTEDSGTSMAAPHVSGVIAAFLSVRREFIAAGGSEAHLRQHRDRSRTGSLLPGRGLGRSHARNPVGVKAEARWV